MASLVASDGVVVVVVIVDTGDEACTMTSSSR
jgi:hypothetical protein